jgi:hypothetical protein
VNWGAEINIITTAGSNSFHGRESGRSTKVTMDGAILKDKNQKPLLRTR